MDIRVQPSSRSVARVTSDAPGFISVRGLRDGSLVTAGLFGAAAIEGKLFTAALATGYTPVTIGATALTTTQPSLAIDVPAGTAIIPVSIEVFLRASAGTLNDVWALTGNNNVGAGTSTALTIRNNATDAPLVSNCSGFGAYTGAGTAPANTNDFWHEGYAFADTSLGPVKDFVWLGAQRGYQVIIGAGTLAIYVVSTTTAATGFIRVTWMELPTNTLV